MALHIERWRCETQIPPPSCGCFGMVALHCVQSGRTVSFHYTLRGLACALSTRRFDRLPVQTALLRRPGTSQPFLLCLVAEYPRLVRVRVLVYRAGKETQYSPHSMYRKFFQSVATCFAIPHSKGFLYIVVYMAGIGRKARSDATARAW